MTSTTLRIFVRLAVLPIVLAPPVAADDVVGPLVGTVESTAAELLYRPGGSPKKLRLFVLAADDTVVQSVDAESKQDSDFVAKFSIRGLSPNTTYRYRIIELGPSPQELIPVSNKYSLTTANSSRRGHRVKVSFVSCVDIEPNEIWSDMAKVGVDTVCLMGDTPYIDSMDLEVVRNKHRKFLQMPDLAALATHTSTIGTWDDHDFGLNNGNGLNLMLGKAGTRRGFVEYRAHAQYGNSREEGVYHKVDRGMIEIFMLDPRYFSQTEKSPVAPEQPTCFGVDQWKWLLRSLRASKAPFKVLSLGAIWQDKKNKETDDLFTYWYERDALLDAIRDEKISGVVLLGGDIHVARHLIHPKRVGYDLHDFVISPGHTRTITKLDVFHPSLEWSLVEGWQYLTLTADGRGETPQLIAEYRQPGKVNRKVVLSLDDLTPTADKPSPHTLRAHWSFDKDLKNQSVLGNRIDATAVNGATLVEDAGAIGGAIRFLRSHAQFLNVPRSFLDDNSSAHTVAMWLKPTSLPQHGSTERSFLVETTAEGKPDDQSAYHLSLGLRAAKTAEQVNLQLYTRTLKPAAEPQAAPTAITQGPFDTFMARSALVGQWNHVTWTFDSKQLTLYLNGEKVSQHTLPISGPASECSGLVIGGHRAGKGRNFDGFVDDLKIYQGLLNEDEIKASATKGSRL